MAKWRDIEGFYDWAVSDQGFVMNEHTQRVVSQRVNQQGLLMVNLWQDRKIHTRLVSLLVGNAFLEPPSNDNYNSVIHLNGDRTDCRAVNLMWRPRWFSIKFHAMFDVDPYRISIYVPELEKRFSSLRELCTLYGLIERDTYISIINNDPCFHYGWKIQRCEE